MFSRVPENLSCCNFSLFFLAIFTVDGEQFITLLSDLVDAVLEENYDLAFLFLSHTPGSYPQTHSYLLQHFHFSERKYRR